MMNNKPLMFRITIKRCSIAISVVFACFVVFSTACWGQGPPRVTLEATSPQRIGLTIGKSIILGSPQPVKRVSLADDKIADAMVLTPRQIYIVGKAAGITNLILWEDREKVSAIVDLVVSPDISRLKEKLHEILPDEKDILVTSSHDRITLSGTVSSTANLSQVLALAESFAGAGGKEGEGKVINLLEVAGVQQVMLEVRVSEISRNLLKELGINFSAVSKGGTNLGIGMLKGLSTVSSVSASDFNIAASVNAIFRFLGGGATWTMFIDALREDGLLKVLAEPTLITLSGKNASFLAGGEFPYPIPQSVGAGANTITIEFKTFGVGLNFTPTVLSNGKINMQVAPEVSELDFGNAVSFQGFVIPGLATRRVSTVVELADGQSFAIAGLLQDSVRSASDRYPIFGDIPILGALFRSQSFKKNETELVVIVTPHLVKPLDLSKQTLPTDQYIEPDDFEYYLLGKLEGKGNMKSASTVPSSPESKTGGLEGEFGHIVP
jgi:pilus assembly protein CpaC